MFSLLQTPEIQARLRTAERVIIAHERMIIDPYCRPPSDLMPAPGPTRGRRPLLWSRRSRSAAVGWRRQTRAGEWRLSWLLTNSTIGFGTIALMPSRTRRFRSAAVGSR